jgi:hypothetical protein
MKLVNSMNYRQWQRRNTEYFTSLTKLQQKEARNLGYCNVGWNKVQFSWQIIYRFTNTLPSLFEHKLRKGDIIGAIELSIFEAERAKHLAQQGIATLDENQKQFDRVADETLAKYPLL